MIYGNVVLDAVEGKSLAKDPRSFYEKIRAGLLQFAETMGDGAGPRVSWPWRGDRSHKLFVMPFATCGTSGRGSSSSPTTSVAFWL